jgi:hypothetical protein
VRDLPEKVEKAGFVVESTRTTNLGSFLELVSRKPAKAGE